MPHINVIGVYPLENEESVHLVELFVHEAQGIVNLTEITQVIPGQPSENWQCPYLEQVLNASGDEVLADDLEASERPELWSGDVRLVFFFHCLDLEGMLRTPFGDVGLPAESVLPERLSMIQYEQP